jgi:hypothetical protein
MALTTTGMLRTADLGQEPYKDRIFPIPVRKDDSSHGEFIATNFQPPSSACVRDQLGKARKKIS